MAATRAEVRRFLQVDTRAALARIGSETWTTVYLHKYDAFGRESYFCAFVPEAQVPQAMEHDTWDISQAGMPGCSQRTRNGKTVTDYYRFGSGDGIMPLVFERSFHGMKPDYIELLEEFRHFHNLYHDRYNDRYIRIDDNGNEEIVAEVVGESVRVKTLRLRQFAAVQRMRFVVFFDVVVRADVRPEDLPARHDEIRHADASLRYTLDVTVDDRARLTDKPFTRLLGKKVLDALPIEQCGIWPYNENEPKQFAAFVIGVDANGRPVEHTCDPDALGNNFGKHPDSAHFLTPIVFRREVLKKYYDHPEKYSVEDGYLRCGGVWGLPIDNDADDRVTVFLGDLGRNLSFEEQLYWKSCNIAPEGGGKDLSATNFRRSLMGEFADPSSAELRFKDLYVEFQEAWEKRFGWQLLRPMPAEDAHVYKRLHAPTTAGVSEFEDQVLLLTKLLVDSLNDAKLVDVLGTRLPDEKSIAKLARFLAAKGYPDADREIEFLRLLQEARSSAAAHRKGETYKKLAQKLKLEERSTTEVFAGLLQSANTMLESLRAFFLPHDDN